MACDTATLAATALQSLRTEFNGASNTEELFATVRELLPLNSECYKIVNVEGRVTKFLATMDCCFSDDAEVHLFVKNYMERTSETLRKMSTHKPSEKNKFEVVFPFRCHHRTYHQPTMNPAAVLKRKPSKKLKNTDCPFSLTFKKRRFATDEYNYALIISYNHNHPTQALQALTFRDISPSVAEKIKTLFSLDYTPGLAYREHLKAIKNECKTNEEFQFKLANRSRMPNTLRSLIFASSNFRETKKIGFREHLFSRIERFQKFREHKFSRIGK